MSQVGSDVWKLTLFTVRLWSINTCSCFDRETRFRFHTTTAPFVAAVAKRWSVKRSAMTVTKHEQNSVQTFIFQAFHY